MKLDQLLFIGTHGHVKAVSKEDGSDVWCTSLPKTGYEVVTLLFEDGVLFAGSNGSVFSLDPHNGSILWSNSLTGLGFDHMVLATIHGAAGLPQHSSAKDDAQQRNSN